ncbi:uncharacterized protein LOC126852014 isoform X1 [Cataglyphis hispanica]|uniref:uncharacterized protein LOC126852014 isoform X1 n=1 Tax=Cataglyphis hispanica TaxID=1086592 RepID=UPI00217FD76F|nr:uncharacterized protein LOC126852014 isoform X1 [Cataglyphis hispanica]XP_050452428.1 uncharacterized protein LOC126852014 isoform X1 [Cataglyphis hispanica]XP_050452429.1 uncharacterized protein LOC126852014 isoform X1 [Cataglyphis hispanica]XP_050452430.1 uncharacterized protein LOC126852014 isoform X1 [Cataglyphis hispanica]
MVKNFAVVTFPSDGNNEEEIVSEVSSLWLSSNLTECWWPSVKNINTFIVKQTPPVTNDPKWTLYPIKFHRYYDSLDEARQRATNYSSSDESNTNQIKKSCTKRSLNTVYNNESESDSDDSRSIIPNPPHLKDTNVSQSAKNIQSISNILDSTIINNIDLEILDGTIVPHKNMQDVYTLVLEMSDKMKDNFEKICTAITTISLNIQAIDTRLKNMETQHNQHKSKASAMDTSNIQRSFPFKSINEVIAFENSLSENTDEYNKFVNLIKLFKCRFYLNRIIEIILLICFIFKDAVYILHRRRVR